MSETDLLPHGSTPTGDILSSFAGQATACRNLGSPFTALLCDVLARGLDDKSAFGQRILSWVGRPKADALPLRAAGALHFLARSGAAPRLERVYPPHVANEAALASAIHAAIADHDALLTGFLDSPPQTNETARSAVILGGALIVANETRLPLQTFEIGASAGLNLHFDRYFYDLGGGRWGDPAADVRLSCAWSGAQPPLDAPLHIAGRAGCDLNPLDPRERSDRERLLAYVWPDQADRLSRMERALAHAASHEERVERTDAADWLERSLSSPATPGCARVVLHTIVWQYLPSQTKARLSSLIEAAGRAATRAAPFAWLRMEADGDPGSAAVTLTLWPEGRERRLGRADFHGRRVRWTDGGERPAD
ncbi:MAG: DUF2332 domain-containing protein [Methylocystaceae bacterium]|nr:MAG: DUF2332 domain-containing protein [Methylocystaceae bacterium]